MNDGYGQSARDLLLADLNHINESFWKNEQAGETRINFFIGLVTAVLAASVALLQAEQGLDAQEQQAVVALSLTALLLLGIVTLMRLVTRNETTDRQKHNADMIRHAFKDHFDVENHLLEHYPFGRSRDLTRRKFGGLSHMVAVINSLLLAGIVGAITYPVMGQLAGNGTYAAASLIAFLLASSAQLTYIEYRRGRHQNKLAANEPTHAGGIVYRERNGAVEYLLVRPSSSKDAWVFPKGKIEQKAKQKEKPAGQDEAASDEQRSDESDIEAALREVREEAGVLVRPICLAGVSRYFVERKPVRCKYYLMETLLEKSEHEDRQQNWLPFSEAVAQLSHVQNKFLIHMAERRRSALRAAEGRADRRS
jgi:8-oxo-dGTP pyrophosphatase MutT (NUDIX family)